MATKIKKICSVSAGKSLSGFDGNERWLQRLVDG
jgi:hypothetical protein